MACDWLFSLGILFQIYKGMKYKPPIFLKLKVLVPLSCLTLWDPMDYSRPGSSGHGILQARILECVAISFSRGTSQPRDRTWVACIVGRRFTVWATREPLRVLECVAISFSRGSSGPRDQTQIFHIAGRRFYRLSPNGSQSLSCLCSMYRIHSLPVFHWAQLNSKG